MARVRHSPFARALGRRSAGAWTWSSVHGHNGFVDPRNKLAVVPTTHTALEGMIAASTREIRDAVYGVAAKP
jgi:hypothetical protein